MKLISSFLCLALAVSLISCSKSPSSSGFVVAEGKGIKITRSDLTKERDEQIHVLNLSNVKIPEEQYAAIDAQILEQMINKALLLNAVAKIPSVNLDKEIENTFNGIKSRFSNEDAFKEQLKKSNLTADKIKKEIKYQVALEKILQAKSKPEELAVSETDIDAFYKNNPQYWKQPDLVRAQHILVFVDPSASEEVKKEKMKAIEDARKRIEKGEPFEKVAEAVSEDPATKNRGGELPPFSKESRVAPEFTETVFKQKVGQLGKVFKSSYGYHLVKVLEKTPARTVPFGEVKEAIKRQLELKKKTQAVQSLLKTLREDADVKVHLPPPKAKNQVTPVPTPASVKTPKND